ncbi:Peroxisomal carnitine O-octanoyltransferase-like [Homarus americanus]|uniref:Peroxisomal carnitine O-octanoyltransferase-like n=1 Tax=Homarus americanus TaxID=6706 RepID=A0A8J5JSP1_HOMAM|nr:Peroxisomal carnitine O-octanoyltransferase-like [Homarus americanus]
MRLISVFYQGKPLTPPELEVQLRHIRETSDALGPGPSLSVLTCDTRENWAQNRDWLKSLSVNNMRNLHHIDSSMLVFVLDDTTPENFNQHTPYDAMVSVMLAHYQYLLFKEMNGKWTGPTEVRYFPMPTLLHFDMDAKLVEAISSAKETSLSYTSEKFHKMKIAMDTHNCHMKQCQNGEGVDRHLFGLYVVALESGMDIPDLFMDPSYTKSGGGGNYVLSTSTVGYSPVFGGTSAMVPQGYGCFYSMVSDRMNFFLSGFKSSEEINVDAFKNALRASLCDMQNILLVPNSSL